jgi:YgiT-type zinc finger domain-containing protein
MEQKEAGFRGSAEAMYERLVAWRKQNGEASFDEIAAEVGGERRRLMSELVAELAMQPKREVEALATQCPQCQGETEGKGSKERWVNHLEGEVRLQRTYRYCPQCGSGFFPPGPETATDETKLES